MLTVQLRAAFLHGLANGHHYGIVEQLGHESGGIRYGLEAKYDLLPRGVSKRLQVREVPQQPSRSHAAQSVDVEQCFRKRRAVKSIERM